MSVEVRIPQIGFSTQEGTLVEWLVADGAPVEEGQLLYTLELDKSVQEIESPAKGTLKVHAETGKVYGDPAQFLCVAAEFPGKNGKNFIDDITGDDEGMFTLYDPHDRLFSTAAGKCQCGDEDIRVKDDPHFLRYRLRSSSVRIPFS